MRVTNKGKNEDKIAQAILDITKKYNLAEHEILLDLYNVFESGGSKVIGSPKVLEKLREKDPAKYWTERNKFFATRLVIGDIANSPTFKMFKALPPLEAVESVAELMSLKQRYMTQLKQGNVAIQSIHTIGHDAADYTREAAIDDVNKVLAATDPDVVSEEKKAMEAQVTVADFLNDLRNTLDFFDSGLAAMLMQTPNPMNTNAQQGGPVLTVVQGGGGAGKSPYVTPIGVEPQRKDAAWLIDTAANFIKVGGASILDIVKNVGEKAGFAEAKQAQTDEITNNSNTEQMTRTEEVVSASAADIQREDFDKRLVEKSLSVQKNVGQEPDKAHLIVLFDVSGSMANTDTAGNRLDRYGYALSILIAMAQQVHKRKDVLHIVPFAGSPGDVVTMDSDKSVVDTINQFIRTAAYGGTSIPNAVRRAYDMINTLGGKYTRCDIVILTDADGTYHAETLRGDKPERTKIIGIHMGTRNDAQHLARMHKLCDPNKCIHGDWDVVNNIPLLKGLLEGL